MDIDDIVSQFSTTPVLFVGSGMSRRYVNLPDWKGLLDHFAQLILDDQFAYRYYENKADGLKYTCGIMPKIAELIQRDFDEKWFQDPSIRSINGEDLEQVSRGVSPFKVEVAAYIKKTYSVNIQYQEEIDKLKEISKKSVSGVITTNYDTFLEDHFQGYKKYIGQNQLIFSAIQGIAEIYKIHGSVEDPSSIVINEDDYEEFNSKSAYLASKLMTIFMEYPIIFMGYSIRDNNIRNIIKSIITCLDEDQVKRLEHRFVFVDYNADSKDISITPSRIIIDDKQLVMTQVTLSDFLPLYEAIGKKRSKLPVRLLRQFKEELYSYVVTSTPTTNLRVASIEDYRLEDEELVLAIGRADQFALHGLSGINGNDWYRNIVLDDIEFSADELLEVAYPNVLRQNSGKLPVNKYLASATKSFSEIERLASEQDFDKIISTTIKKNRGVLGQLRSAKEIWEAYHADVQRAAYLISHLTEAQIDVDEVEQILSEIFIKEPDILEKASSQTRTDIRRLIRIYDYLKWGKNKGAS